MKLQLFCMLRNLIVLGIFAVLAILFGKWWIVFFSILFMGYAVKEK